MFVALNLSSSLFYAFCWLIFTSWADWVWNTGLLNFFFILSVFFFLWCSHLQHFPFPPDKHNCILVSLICGLVNILCYVQKEWFPGPVHYWTGKSKCNIKPYTISVNLHPCFMVKCPAHWTWSTSFKLQSALSKKNKMPYWSFKIFTLFLWTAFSPCIINVLVLHLSWLLTSLLLCGLEFVHL